MYSDVVQQLITSKLDENQRDMTVRLRADGRKRFLYTSE